VIIAEPGEYQAKAPVDEIGQRTPQTLCSPDALRFNSLSYPEIRHGFSAISRSCLMAVFKTARSSLYDLAAMAAPGRLGRRSRREGQTEGSGLNGGGSACTSRQSINARHGIGRSQSAELGPNLGPTPAIGHHGTLACDRAAATSTLAGDTQTDPADLGVKGSRVQMSPALPNTQRVTSRRSVR
jgi:hypothetical protein